MTKMQIRYALQRPLDEALMQRIADAHAIYGIHRIQVSPSLDELTVEYDATRMKRDDVQAALAGAGIPVLPQAA
jgi:hypothetical protein